MVLIELRSGWWVLAGVENRVGGGGFCSGCWYWGEVGLRW